MDNHDEAGALTREPVEFASISPANGVSRKPALEI